MPTSLQAPPSVSTDRCAVSAFDLVKTYGKDDTVVRALDGVSVGFGAEQFTAIMGPSGSGKSTLMHCLAGLDTCRAGRCTSTRWNSPACPTTPSRGCGASTSASCSSRSICSAC